MTRRWTHRPEHSNWGEWGEEDQLGRLNMIGPDQVLKGIQEVKSGTTFCLSLPLDYPGGNVLSPVRFPPKLRPVIRNDAPYFNYDWRQIDPSLKDIAADDAVLLHTQYSTQWDSLAHRGSVFDAEGNGTPEPMYYNGFRAGKDLVFDGDTSCASKLGIENMAEHGVQGRAVMVDLHSKYGDYPQVAVGYKDLMQAMEEQNVVVEPGDILCVWTGLDRLILEGQGDPDPAIKEACAALNGWDDKLLQWIIDSGVAAIVSDNIAVEVIKRPLPACHCGTSLPLHDLCLFKLGIHLGELWHLAELNAWLKNHARNRFLLTAPPLRLTGAVGSPVTPIATV
ncbi:cyclase family protein [Akkermansiaceae bacterium]|nr:cyclase family protein [Akkermansiaceae bacterium]